MFHKLTIPGTIDPLFLKEAAGIIQPWGVGSSTTENCWDIAFAPAKLDDVLAVLEEYDALFLAHRKSERLEELADVRRVHEKLGPSGLTLDDKTVLRINGAASWLTLDPSVVSVRWEVSRGIFQTFPKAVVLGLAVAVAQTVQACFNNVSDLTDAINAAEDLATLEAIDLETGWPS